MLIMLGLAYILGAALAEIILQTRVKVIFMAIDVSGLLPR